MINPVNYLTNIARIGKKTKPVRTIQIQDTVPESVRQKLVPCFDSLKYWSEKYNLSVDIATSYKNSINNNIYVTNKPNKAFVIIDRKSITEINSGMKDTDILRKVYELVSRVIKK